MGAHGLPAGKAALPDRDPAWRWEHRLPKLCGGEGCCSGTSPPPCRVSPPDQIQPNSTSLCFFLQVGITAGSPEALRYPQHPFLPACQCSVTSLCPVPLGHTCQDHLNVCLRPRWPPTPRPAQPANHPSCAVPPQRGPMLIKHEAETTKYVKTHLKFIVSYHTFESLERRPVFLPLRDGAYLLSPTLRVYV